MYKSPSNSNFNVKKIIISHICYTKQNVVPSKPHTQNFILNKNINHYNHFHVKCYLKATYDIL